MTDDLTAFLHARLDDDEQIARAAATRERGGASWTLANEHDSKVQAGSGLDIARRTPPVLARHIARHDPARVLREVEAKRQILAEHDTESWELGDRLHDCQWNGPNGWPCTTLRLLALPYTDHPDYREEWRP